MRMQIKSVSAYRFAMRTKAVLFLLTLSFGMPPLVKAQEGTATGPQPPLRFPKVRIMVVIPETHILMRRVPDPAGETEIIRVFTEAGYQVVDQTQVAAIRYTPQVEAALRNPTGPEARALTAAHGADILIVGEAFSETVRRIRIDRQTVFSARARVEARAVVIRDGRILAAHGAHAGGMDPAELIAGKIALRKAGGLVGEYLLDKIGEFVGGPRSVRQPSHTFRIAVVPFEYVPDSGLGRDMADTIGTNLLEHPQFKLKRFKLVDRDTINIVLKERLGGVEGLFDNSDRLAELGGLLSADYLFIGRIKSAEPRKLFIPARVEALVKVVDLNAEILAQDNVTGKASYKFGESDKRTILRAMNEAAEMAVKTVFNDQFLPKIGVPPSPVHCGTYLPLESKFCPKCGKPVVEQVEQQDRPCPKCEKPLPPDARFCPHCGEPVPDKKESQKRGKKK